MPSHCYVCGHSDFTHWDEFSAHMAKFHAIKVNGSGAIVRPTRTSSRSKAQIVHALEGKLGRHNFFAYRAPGLEDEYAAFVRKLRS